MNIRIHNKLTSCREYVTNVNSAKLDGKTLLVERNDQSLSETYVDFYHNNEIVDVDGNFKLLYETLSSNGLLEQHEKMNVQKATELVDGTLQLQYDDNRIEKIPHSRMLEVSKQ